MKTIGIFLAFACGLILVGLANISGLEPLVRAEQPQPEFGERNMAIRLTYGRGGSTRQEEIIAGEQVHLSLAFSSLGLTQNGKVDCKIDGVLLNPTGGTVFDIPARPLNGQSLLGGSNIGQFLSLPTSPNAIPGKYQFIFRVYDGQGTQRAKHSFFVLVQPHTTFGAANIGMFHDANGTCPAYGVFAVGENLNLGFALVGSDTTKNRLFVECKLNVADENGNVVSPEPIVSIIDKQLRNAEDKDAVDRGLSASFNLGLSRPGKFSLQLELKDNISNNTRVHRIPFVVVQSP